jgi:hypothetical protein
MSGISAALLFVAATSIACGGQPGALAAAPAAANPSRVTRLDITSRTPAFGGTAFDRVGPYELLIGRAAAVIDPAAGDGIVDLDKAPRNASGLVEYSFDVQILKPVDVSKGNGVLAYEVNNRGGRLVYNAFNEGGAGYESANVGNGFLMKEGYTVVWSGWMPGESRTGSPAAPPPIFAEFPVASDRGRPIVGTAREEWIRDTAPALASRLTYPAASLDQSQATLTYRQNEAGKRLPLSTAHWSYADDRTVKVTPPPDADAGTIYEFIYQATQPIVAGLGFTGIRDIVSFLRYTAADDAGTSNPLFVNGAAALKVAVATGMSQSGRVQRDFIYQGFNRDPQGRKVFDGMNPIVAGGRRTYVNYRFAQPGRFTRQHEDHLYPMDEFPFTWATTSDPLTGKTDGLLAVCSRSNTCPLVIQVDSDSESYVSPGSLVLTDPSGQPVALPANVRYYYLTTAHSQANPGCRDAAHPVSPSPYYRAAFDALVRWTREGVMPPATSAPSRADGTFVTVTEQQQQYPAIPGKPYTPRISEIGVRDFSVFPPSESAARYPQYVPRLDRDGNPLAGVIIPEIAVPVATLSGRAVRRHGFGEGDLCNVNGSAIPFAKTRAERVAQGDPRLSLQERYPGAQAEYATKYASAVEKLVADRYLLPADGVRLKAAAALPQ